MLREFWLDHGRHLSVSESVAKLLPGQKQRSKATPKVKSLDCLNLIVVPLATQLATSHKTLSRGLPHTHNDSFCQGVGPCQRLETTSPTSSTSGMQV